MYEVAFYETAGGNEVVIDFLRALPKADRDKVGADLKELQIGFPMGMPLSRKLRGKIWELRSSLPSKREVRLLYFFDSVSQIIVVVHAFFKTTQTTPKPDIDLAEKRNKEY